MSARQWQAAAPHIAAISELGVRFCHAWASSRLTPYIQKRFALEAAQLAAADEDLEFRYDDVWAKLFNARPKGHHYCLDEGATMVVALYYERWEQFNFERLKVDRRRKTDHAAPAILAAEAAYDWVHWGRDTTEAPAQAGAVLVEQGLWPSDGPLPWWPLPRERADGDWLIGALARLRKALARSLSLLEEADGFERQWRDTLSQGLRGDAGALEVMAIAAGAPALTQGSVTETLGLSKKAAQKALNALEKAGAIVEITGRTDWRVWLADNTELSAPLANANASIAHSDCVDVFVSTTKPIKPSKPVPIDYEWHDAEIAAAMAGADNASRRLRELAKREESALKSDPQKRFGS